MIFLSTPSARRATAHPTTWVSLPTYFYPRPPRGGRLHPQGQANSLRVFLSTPSARRATWRTEGVRRGCHISIHALREEGDFAFSTISTMSSYFYPRPPRGGRRTAYKYSCGSFPFLSTPSARRATCSSLTSRRSTTISIHALREEGDCSDTVHHRCCRYFYPRPPRGGRLTWEIVAAACISISIHALREEGDPRRLRRCLLPCHFYPRPPRGGRPPSGA